MLYKFRGFHCGDCEECRHLGDKTEFVPYGKHVSSSKAISLMLCKIWGFLGGDYEKFHLLWCDTVWLLLLVTANVTSSVIFSTLMIRSFEASVIARGHTASQPRRFILQWIIITDRVPSHSPQSPGQKNAPPTQNCTLYEINLFRDN
jgi:hypothetical protein